MLAAKGQSILKMKLSQLAFRIFAIGMSVTQFRTVTGADKHCCQSICPTVVRSHLICWS